MISLCFGFIEVRGSGHSDAISILHFPGGTFLYVDIFSLEPKHEYVILSLNLGAGENALTTRNNFL